MARGFLNGALWGSGASICALGVLSVLSDGPNAPEGGVPAPVAQVAPQPEARAPEPPRTERKPATGQQVPAPEPDTLAGVRSESTARPETGEASALSGPDVDTGQPSIETATRETPVVPSAPSTALQAPRAAPSISVSTDPAQPLPPEGEPEVVSSLNPVQPAPPAQVESSSGFGAEVNVPESPPAIAPSISEEPNQPQMPTVPVETQAFETQTPVEGAKPPTPIAPKGTVFDQGDSAPLLDINPAPQATVAPPADPALQEGRMSNPVGGAENRKAQVQVNRLPTLGEENEPEAVVPNAKSLRPVERFASAFNNIGNKPVMAIILMDAGVDFSRGGIGLPALRSFPYPISFAVDTNLPDAKERMAAYRAEGFEVLAMVDLPAGAQARDAEVTLAVALEAVPEAVGVLEGIGEGVQGSRDAALQVAEILAKTGHGFITQNKGLNTVQKLAAKSGVPSAVVFREFDSAQQTPTVIRRFLDQAAFKARSEGNVIMLGRLREDTISALLIWGLQDRARSVALAPVSAALQSQ